MMDLDGSLMRFLLSEATKYDFMILTVLARAEGSLAILCGFVRWQSENGLLNHKNIRCLLFLTITLFQGAKN